jgi:CRP-like cAMP-binding protein
VLQGEVELSALKNKRDAVVEVLGPGQYCGETSWISDAPSPLRATSRGTVKGLMLSRQRLESYLISHDATALSVLRALAKDLSRRLDEARTRGPRE